MEDDEEDFGVVYLPGNFSPSSPADEDDDEDSPVYSPSNFSPSSPVDEERENQSNNNLYHSLMPYEIARRNRSHSTRRQILKEDRISPLPDSLIHHILSFLPAEEAVETGVLSKRWVYLWTSVPNLTFRCPYYTSIHNGFLEFVDRTLFFHSSSKIEKFVLDFKYKSSSAALIHKWLRWVARHDAREVSLKFGERNSNLTIYDAEQRYPMPQFVFNNSSLEKLSTRFCDYAPQGQVSWRSLRVLIIEHTELSNDVLQRILLGSPMLEYLELHGCKGATSIDLSYSPTLEFLKVHNCWPLANIHSGSRSRLEKLVLKEMAKPEDGSDGVIEISCPSLKSMEISGSWESKKCRLLNVSSLIHVCLNFEVDIDSDECFDMMKQLLENIKHAKRITLGTWCIQVLSILEFRGLPSPMSESICKCLILDTDFNSWDTFGMASLLHSLPILQNLVIDLTNNRNGEIVDSSDYSEFRDYFEENDRKSEDRISSCLLRHLKTVEIVGLEAYNKVLENDLLAFVRFVLGNARVLKKMVLTFKSTRRDSDYLYHMTQKLLSFPRCSTRVVVLTKNS